jgi:hypothetical protein
MRLSETGNLSTPQAEVSVSPPQPRRGRLLPIFFGLAVIALLVGAVFLTWQQLPYRLPLGTQITQLNNDIAALKSEVQALDARVTALQQSPPSPDLAAQLSSIEMRLADAERMLAQTADQKALQTLQDRVARVESGSPGEMLKTAAAMLARANLARAAQASGQFKPEWEALRAIAPDDPAVGALQPYADISVPARNALLASFPEAARASLAADQQANSDGNLASRLWARLRGLISVRRVGDVQGDTNEEHLARAQADADRSDLSGAVKEAQAVTGPAATALEPWLKNAEARVAIDSVVLDMNSRIIQALATAPSAP